MLAAITGASGLLGANLAEILLREGHRVRATRRATTKIDHVSDLAIEWAEGDLSSAADLTAAFQGVDVVFHCAAAVGVRKGVSPGMQAANVDGTRNVIEAVRAARVPRLVHTSSVVAVGLSTDGAPCTEACPWNFAELGLDDGYAITKRAAEELVRAARDVDAVIVNPTYMFGPRDARPSSGGLIIDIARRKVPGWTPGYNNFADVRDVARGMLAAWRKGARGERYILGGRNLTYREVMQQIAEVAGVKPPRLGMPRAFAKMAGFAGDLAEKLGRDPLITSTTVRYAYTRGFQFSSDRAVKELGYSISPLAPAIADSVAWFRQRGMLPS